jgi:hypothetical protein
VPLGGLTTRVAEAGGQIGPPSGPIAPSGGPTAHPVALSTSSAPRAAMRVQICLSRHTR